VRNSYVDHKGQSKSDPRFRDSIWNFHVWTEVWFHRKDLPIPFDFAGWQVIDATPQEKSQGLFQHGPASVIGIKNGQVNFNYDSGFTFSMSNADVIYWTDYKNHLKKIKVEKDQIGTSFLTKKIGADVTDSDNIINDYKYAENSEHERWVVRTVGFQMMLPYLYDDDVQLRSENTTVGFRFVHPPVQMWGANLIIIYQLFNKKSQPLKINFTMQVDLMFYNGVSQENLKMTNELIRLDKREGECKVIPTELFSMAQTEPLFGLTFQFATLRSS
jgi:hypothetical protein